MQISKLTEPKQKGPKSPVRSDSMNSEDIDALLGVGKPKKKDNLSLAEFLKATEPPVRIPTKTKHM